MTWARSWWNLGLFIDRQSFYIEIFFIKDRPDDLLFSDKRVIIALQNFNIFEDIVVNRGPLFFEKWHFIFKLF